VDLVKELTIQLEESQNKLNDAENRIVQFEQDIQKTHRQAIIKDVTEGLSLNQAQKLNDLAKFVEFKEEKEYRQNLEILKSSIVSANKKLTENKSSQNEEFEALNEQQTEQKPVVDKSMQKYADALKTTKI